MDNLKFAAISLMIMISVIWTNYWLFQIAIHLRTIVSKMKTPPANDDTAAETEE